MTVNKIQIRQHEDVVEAGKAGRRVASRLGLAPAMEACLDWAIREVTRKALALEHGGTCVIEDQSDSRRILVRVLLDREGTDIALSSKRA